MATNFLNPADKIIRLFDGPTRLSRLMGLGRSSVHRWRLPRDRGGCDGVIPSPNYAKLFEVAREHGVALTPDDLIPLPSSLQNVSAPKDQAA